jgi:hypothetical protein
MTDLLASATDRYVVVVVATCGFAAFSALAFLGFVLAALLVGAVVAFVVVVLSFGDGLINPNACLETFKVTTVLMEVL